MLLGLPKWCGGKGKSTWQCRRCRRCGFDPRKKNNDKSRQPLKSRDITLLTNVHIYESWTIKKDGHQRIYVFELWCWRRLLRISWTARRSNQSILKEISSEYSLEGLTLKLKLQYFGHLMRRTDSFEKTHAGKHWRWEEKGMTEDEMVGWNHWLDAHEFE